MPKTYLCKRDGCDKERNRHNTYCSPDCRVTKGLYATHIDAIRRMYTEEFLTDEEIASALPIKTTRFSVYQWRTKAGIPSISTAERKKHRPEKTQTAWNVKDLPREEVERLLSLGLTYREVGRRLGVSLDTIRQRIGVWGIARTQDEIAEVRKATVLEKYGVESAALIPEVQARIKKTNLERYGSENPFGSMGVRATLNSHLPEGSFAILSDATLFVEHVKANELTTVFQIAESLGCSYTYALRKSHSFGVYLELDHQSSRLEELVEGWLTDMGVHDAQPAPRILDGRFEIDLYSPSRSIGIEVNGSRFHSEKYKERRYHYNKSVLAAEAGIRLYHAFEYELDDTRKRPIVFSQIANMFGFSTNKIGARKCNVVSVSANKAQVFLDQNHLQGNVWAKVSYGLEYEGELVSLMTFGRPRYDKSGVEWELLRFCNRVGTTVPGAASRLFKRFLADHNPASVLSYSNKAKTTGNMYSVLGFEHVGTSDPNYVWFNLDTRDTVSRYKTQFKGEVETMKDRGYERIFDCGNDRWLWTKPE